MIRNVGLLSLLLAATGYVFSHPGVGIVADSKGNVYYTDLSRVWRIAVDGRKSVAVAGVHTHELWIDSLDNLYGEHLWYEGDATGRWGHRIWKRTPDGSVSDVIPSRSGFRDDYDDFHFVRDREETMYWLDEDSVTTFRKRKPGGEPVELLKKPVRRAGWLTVSPAGTLYLVERNNLISVSGAGRTDTVAKGITEPGKGGSGGFDEHSGAGLSTDREGNVYIAVPERHSVLRVGPDRKLSVIDTSASSWNPSGVLNTGGGELWILEYSATNEVRVRHVQRDGITRIF